MNTGWELELKDGFGESMSLIRALERHYGAQILAYDVDPTGEIVVDVLLDGRNPAVRAVRIRDRESRIREEREAIRARRNWGDIVRTHTESVRDMLRQLRRDGDLTT